MMLAAAYAIAGLSTDADRSEEHHSREFDKTAWPWLWQMP